MLSPTNEQDNTPSIPSLVQSLASREAPRRQWARDRLIACGRDSTPALSGALTSPDSHVRWEAAKALGAIRDPQSSTSLAERLNDPDGDVRWVAAEALIEIGVGALEPVLHMLTKHPESSELRQAVHHVVHTHFDEETDRLLAPVVAALDGSAPEAAAPVAAYQVLEATPHWKQ